MRKVISHLNNFLANFSTCLGLYLTKFKYERRLMEFNPNPRILMCKYAEEVEFVAPKGCQSFHLSMTSDGIGYTFNNANFWDIFRETKFTNLFAKIMRPKGFDKEPSPSEVEENDDYLNLRYPNNGILFPWGIGPLYGLQVRSEIRMHFIFEEI